MPGKVKGDRILDLALWFLSFSVFFAYCFIELETWLDFYIFYIFCGFSFYITLFRVLLKKRKRKFDYVLPLINLYISIPGGLALDVIVKLIENLMTETSAEVAFFSIIYSMCLLVVVYIMLFVLYMLLFWEEHRNKK